MKRMILTVAAIVFLAAPAKAQGVMPGVSDATLQSACVKLAEDIEVYAKRYVDATNDLKAQREAKSEVSNEQDSPAKFFKRITKGGDLEMAGEELYVAAERLRILSSDYHNLMCGHILK